jgi:hypothetical protein
MSFEYEIEGIKVTIIENDRLDPALRNIIRVSIFSACTFNKLVQHFPQITFILLDEFSDDKETFAAVNEKDIIAGNYVVSIATKSIKEDSYTMSYEKLVRLTAASIIHELTHVVQMMITSANEQRSVILKKLREQLQKLAVPNLYNARILLSSFMQLLRIEGLAEYNRYLYLGKAIFSQNRFDNLLETANRCATEISTYFRFYIEPTDSKKSEPSKVFYDLFAGDMLTHIYPIGVHMVYTILYFDDMITLEKLMKINYLDFINKYENCMQKKGYDPVVALTNSKGILVYKKMLKGWYDLLQKCKNKEPSPKPL